MRLDSHSYQCRDLRFAMELRATMSRNELIELAHKLADLSGTAIMPHFRVPIAVENKLGPNGFDPVTAADRGAEQVIAEYLTRTHPDHRIVGEEYGHAGGSGSLQWVIDPIDGTKAFIMGSPLWGTLIGLLDGGAPVLGLMDQPFTGERVWSHEDGVKWRDPRGQIRKISTRACPRIEDAILTTTSPDLIGSGAETDAFLRLKAQARMTRYGGDCYGYCLLAAGHVDLVVETGLKPHDIVALIPIIEGAGGRVTTWAGEPATNGGRIVAAGDARLHEAAMKVLAG